MEQQDQVNSELNGILASPQFAGSRRMQRFLEFVVRQALKGASADIKEYTIGVEVFDRPQDYDPRIDSIVRVEARRLRRKLREYYAGPGKKDEVIISLPEGSYVPMFVIPHAEEHVYQEPPRQKDAGTRLAVLPFDTIPPSEDARMLGDALMDDLLGSLAKLPGVRVVARSAALRYRVPERDLKSIGRELGVDWILEGVLRRSADAWRLSAHLAECETSYTRWNENYSAGSVEIQKLHLRITREIAAHLGVAVPESETPADSEANINAFRHLLGARHLMLQMTPCSLALAAQAFRRSIKADPTLAAGWAGYAGCLLMAGLFGDTAPNMVEAEVSNALDEAFRLNPELAQAHAWRGFHKATYEWDFDAAEEHLLHALETNPNYLVARLWLACAVYAPVGRLDEALEQLAQARKLDAANPLLLSMEGYLRASTGDLEQALKVLTSAMSFSQTFYVAHHVAARVLAAHGRYGEALRFLESARPRAGADPRNLALIAAMHAWLGDREAAIEIQASLKKARQHDYVSAYDMAIMALSLGQKEAAAAYLMQALAEHEPWLVYLRHDSLLQPLRGTPQYQEADRLIFSDTSK